MIRDLDEVYSHGRLVAALRHGSWCRYSEVRNEAGTLERTLTPMEGWSHGDLIRQCDAAQVPVVRPDPVVERIKWIDSFLTPLGRVWS